MSRKKQKDVTAETGTPAVAVPTVTMHEAPTFDAARLQLYKCLDEWVFSRVIRPCTIPLDAIEIVGTKEVVTYYHGIAMQDVDSVTTRRVWFKKPPSSSQSARGRGRGNLSEVPTHVFIGPIRLSTRGADYIPQVGEVLMGKIVIAEPAPPTDDADSRTPPARPRRAAAGGGAKYSFWFPGAEQLRLLYTLVCNGTSLTEYDLAPALRHGTRVDASGLASSSGGGRTTAATPRSRRGGDGAADSDFGRIKKRKSVTLDDNETGKHEKGSDDTWALARLILFGNVAAFAAEHRSGQQREGAGRENGGAGAATGGGTERVMNLSCAPLQFVYSCSKFFKDDSIWTQFQKLVPDAAEPEEDDDDDANDYLAHRNDVKNDKPYYDGPRRRPTVVVVGTTPRNAAATGVVSDTRRQGFATTWQPSTSSTSYDVPGAYNPCSPLYSPATPPYNPATPPHEPATPPYDPATPPYQPVSPPYQPVSPPYQPVSPPYQPVTPPCEERWDDGVTPCSPAYNPWSPSNADEPPPGSPPYNPGTPPSEIVTSDENQDHGGVAARVSAVSDVAPVAALVQRHDSEVPEVPAVPAPVGAPQFDIEQLRAILREVAEIQKLAVET